jgi:hypothetical protein
VCFAWCEACLLLLLLIMMMCVYVQLWLASNCCLVCLAFCAHCLLLFMVCTHAQPWLPACCVSRPLQEVSLLEASQALQRDYLKNNKVIDLAAHAAQQQQR